VFAEHDAGVEDVDAAVGTLEVFDFFFEAGDAAAFDAEDGEELCLEGLCVGAFAGAVGPFGGELHGVGADLGEGEAHVWAERIERSRA